MGSKQDSSTEKKLEALEEAKRKWDRVRSLIERAADRARGRDTWLRQCQRASNDVARLLLMNGFGALASDASELAFQVKRGGRFESKVPSMREQVAKVSGGIERAEHSLRSHTPEHLLDSDASEPSDQGPQ